MCEGEERVRVCVRENLEKRRRLGKRIVVKDYEFWGQRMNGCDLMRSNGGD